MWVNTVGTYGVSSAGYWWARVAAALLVRLFHYILSPAGDQDALLHADDLFTTVGTKQEIVDIGAMLLIWEALGTPWKWCKFRRGYSCKATGSISRIMRWASRGL